jgi:hypothetical protein
MALTELIDTIDSMLGGGASVSSVRNQLVILREQAEALESSIRTPELPAQDDALTNERNRLQTLLDEANQEIARLRQAQESDQSSAAKHAEKAGLVREAIAQGRPVCHCSPTGEVMLGVKVGLGRTYIYRCPRCNRTVDEDGPNR